MALYEMNSPHGSLQRAAELLEMASRASPFDVTIRHSRAELLLRLADVARTRLEREQRLREAMQIASSLRQRRNVRGNGSHAVHTMLKIGLKRLKDVLEDPSPTVSGEAVSAAIRAVEDNLLDGLQSFPDDSYLLSSEAELATLLQDSARAIGAMRSAFKTNPRNGVIAVRLAKSLEASGDRGGARGTLETGLESNPGDKNLHYALAKFIMRHTPERGDEVEYHLQRAFTEGDRNYDAQLLYARQLYIRGDVDRAKERFRSLRAARVSPDVREKVRYPMDQWFNGRVERLEATYCFVARDGVGDWVFAHRAAMNGTLWDEMSLSRRVRFRVAFSMKGPAAVDLDVEKAGA